MKFTLWFTVY